MRAKKILTDLCRRSRLSIYGTINRREHLLSEQGRPERVLQTGIRSVHLTHLLRNQAFQENLLRSFTHFAISKPQNYRGT